MDVEIHYNSESWLNRYLTSNHPETSIKSYQTFCHQNILLGIQVPKLSRIFLDWDNGTALNAPSGLKGRIVW
jgi:hypothetical protein